MAKSKDMKQAIIESAWELFYERGFEETTVQDIIDKAGIAKGSFYYHFKGKDTLLNTLSDLLDEKYKELEEAMPEGEDSFQKLVWLNYQMHDYIGKRVDCRLLARLYSTQLIKSEESNLLDQERYYFRLITRLIREGQERGELSGELSTQEIMRYYSMCERAMVTDWCMNEGNYSLGEYSKECFPFMLAKIKA